MKVKRIIGRRALEVDVEDKSKTESAIQVGIGQVWACSSAAPSVGTQFEIIRPCCYRPGGHASETQIHEEDCWELKWNSPDGSVSRYSCGNTAWILSSCIFLVEYFGPDEFTKRTLEEHRKASAKHPGTDRIPNGTGGGGRKTMEINARRWCERAQTEGLLTYKDIWDEESCELLACDPDDDEAIESELWDCVQVAYKWLREIRRRRAERVSQGQP